MFITLIIYIIMDTIIILYRNDKGKMKGSNTHAEK